MLQNGAPARTVASASNEPPDANAMLACAAATDRFALVRLNPSAKTVARSALPSPLMSPAAIVVADSGDSEVSTRRLEPSGFK